MIYIIFYFIVFILSFKIKKDKYTIFDYLLITIIVLFSGLRMTGTDYFLYHRLFNNLSLNSRTGIGFRYVMFFIKIILNLDYQVLIFLVALVTNVIFYRYFKKKTNNPGLAILIYISAGFYTTSFNMFRQTLCIALILLSFDFLKDGKKVKAIAMWIISFLFHSSSIIAIIIYLIFHLYKNKKIKFRYLLAFVILGLLFYNPLFTFVITSFDSYSLYMNYNSTPGLGTCMNVFVYLLITLILVIPKYKETSVDNYTIYNLFLVGVSIMVLELKNYLFFRIAFYFTILLPIILANSYENHSFKNKKIESLLFYIALFVYYLFYINSFDGVIPYNFFF